MKIIYPALTLPICLLMGAWELWVGFTLTFLLFGYKEMGKSVLWEIPMAILALGIISEVAEGDTDMVLRILLPLSAFLIAYANPRRLFFVLAVSGVMLFLKTEFSLSVMWAVAWYSARCVCRNKFRPKYFTTKTKVLQD